MIIRKVSHVGVLDVVTTSSLPPSTRQWQRLVWNLGTQPSSPVLVVLLVCLTTWQPMA